MTIIDLHIHTTIGSGDSVIDPDDLIVIAKEKGLHGVCITEHGNTKPKTIDELSRRHNFLVIGGIEASTELGDILIFGVDDYPFALYKARDVAEYVKKMGGIMVAAHPFRHELSNRPWATLDSMNIFEVCQREIFKLVDAMEVVNGWSSQIDFQFSLAVCEQLGMRGTGGSDAHRPKEIGLCVTEFENSIKSEAEFLSELRKGHFTFKDNRNK
ncbi:MAG: PHP-associated domain-containing protein [Thermodesulfobacteriota bacterium]|nr:PHP-associated domain-containing protein [Thermodesulfobacteriota bacterium]